MGISLNIASPVPFLSCDAFSAVGGVAHGFSTRLGGVSQGDCAGLNLGYSRGDDPACVTENLRRFTAAIGADNTRLVKTRQVHGDHIHPVTARDVCTDFFSPAPWECDGLITNEPGLCLTIFTADCVPVLLYDPARPCIAAVHSGWRGTALSIAPKAVERMVTDYGCRREDILAAIGPSISRCCFETHSDVPDALIAGLGIGISPFIHPLPAGKFKVDLAGIIAHTLTLAGLSPHHIHTTDHCTACRTDLYWSHRVLGDRRGSMASMIQLL